jgi:NAD+ kinase
MEEGLHRLRNGDYDLSFRTVLAGYCGSIHFSALNDIVIKSADLSHLIDLQVSADGQMINEYSADGLIIATPTGSTAYNLSAKGPILHPHMDAIILNAICPHTLSDCSLILPAQTNLTISWTPGQAILMHDAWPIDIPPHTSHLTITRAAKALSIIYFENIHFFDLLRSKLHICGKIR